MNYNELMSAKELIKLNDTIKGHNRLIFTINPLATLFTIVAGILQPISLIAFVPALAFLIYNSVALWRAENYALSLLGKTRKELRQMRKSGELDRLAKYIEENKDTIIDNDLKNALERLRANDFKATEIKETTEDKTIENTDNEPQSQDTLIQKSISRTSIYLSKPKNSETAAKSSEEKSVEERQDISRTSMYLNQPKDNYEI